MKRITFRGAGRLLGGYTIVEVTIFLAISGALLIAVSGLITGRQERVRFTQAVVDLDLSLQDVFNDTATGYFPSNGDFSCTPTGDDFTAVPVFDTGPGENIDQGSNTGCIFVGKLLQFFADQGYPPPGVLQPDSAYKSYTLVGTQFADENTLSLDPIPFKVLGGTYDSGVPASPGISEDKSLGSALKVTAKLIDLGNGNSYYSLGVLSGFGEKSGSSITGNASRVTLYGFKGNPLHSSNGLRDGSARAEFIKIEGPLVICLNQDNDSGRPAALLISKQLTIERQIDEQPPECQEPGYN